MLPFQIARAMAQRDARPVLARLVRDGYPCCGSRAYGGRRLKVGRFLFAMWEGGGTGPPELAVASRLVARGHEVTVLGDPSLSQDVSRTGAQFSPWRAAPHRTTRTAESEIVR